MTLRIPLNQIHQLELSSCCNFRCEYCPHGQDKMGRPKHNMSMEVFSLALDWINHFVRVGTQREVNLAGLGESLLNPNFIKMLALVREVIGEDHPVVLATNGSLITEELVRQMLPYHPEIWVSAHQPAKIVGPLKWLTDAGLLRAITIDPATGPNDWAGQIKWVKPSYEMGCSWINAGWGFVASDGRFLNCCLDASGAGDSGFTVFDTPGSATVSPYKLCRGCYQKISIPGFDQSQAGEG